MSGNSPANPVPPGGEWSKVINRLQVIATSSAASIIALHSAAFAKTDTSSQPNVTIIDARVPIMSPEALAAAGTTIATIAAYALMKARKRGRGPKDE